MGCTFHETCLRKVRVCRKTFDTWVTVQRTWYSAVRKSRVQLITLNLIFVHITFCYVMSEKYNRAQLRTLFVLSFIYHDMFYA